MKLTTDIRQMNWVWWWLWPSLVMKLFKFLVPMELIEVKKKIMKNQFDAIGCICNKHLTISTCMRCNKILCEYHKQTKDPYQWFSKRMNNYVLIMWKKKTKFTKVHSLSFSHLIAFCLFYKSSCVLYQYYGRMPTSNINGYCHFINSLLKSFLPEKCTRKNWLALQWWIPWKWFSRFGKLWRFCVEHFILFLSIFLFFHNKIKMLRQSTSELVK